MIQKQQHLKTMGSVNTTGMHWHLTEFVSFYKLVLTCSVKPITTRYISLYLAYFNQQTLVWQSWGALSTSAVFV